MQISTLLTVLVLGLMILVSGCYVYERPTHTMLWNIQSVNSSWDDMNTLPPLRLEIATELVYSSDQLSRGASFGITRASLKGGGIISTESYVESASPIAPRDIDFVAKKADSWSNFMALCDSSNDERGPLMLYEGDHPDPELPDTEICNPDNPEAGHYFFFFDSNRPSEGVGDDIDRDIYWYNVKADPFQPHEVGFNSRADDAYPTRFEEGTLLFSSNRSGGKGGWDLWETRAVQGAESAGDVAGVPGLESTALKNLNSRYDDLCPYYLPWSEGTGILVFISNRQSEGKDYDLYCSIYGNGVWSDPVRLEATTVEYAPGEHKGVSADDCTRESGLSADGTVWYATDGKQKWINSLSNEFRPVLIRPASAGSESSGGLWMIYSSDREDPHAYGGYDLYLAWLDFDDVPVFKGMLKSGSR